MYVIVGLGNPGRKYMHTRHNAGFLAVELLARKYNIEIKKYAHKAAIGEGYIDNQKVVLALPETFMNDSGQSVVALLNWYKIDSETELIVLYDDIDLPVGQLRIRARGSAGTHNGMRSILYLTGTDAFARIRIGIGKPKAGWALTGHVLGEFDEDERETMMHAFEEAGEAVEKIIRFGVMDAQAAYNVKRNKQNAQDVEEK